MFSLFLLFRCASFASFVVCNAIICSVAAWNLSFVQQLRHVVHIDIYLIFLGAFGLAVVLPVIFVDVLRKGAISSRVWFEVSWLTLFWILNFAGATAVTAIAPGQLCNFTISRIPSDACTSSRVLVVFAWLNTGFVFLYFFFLTLFAIIHQKDDPRIWHSGVRDFPWFRTKQCLRSAPSTPVMARFAKTKPPSFVVPKPRRPPPIFVQHRAGLSSNVEIEHFPDPASLAPAPVQAPVAVSMAVAAPHAVSLYPQHVQTSLRPTPSAAPSSLSLAPQNATYYPSQPGPSPPPLRDWPRPLATSSTVASLPLSERALQKQRSTTPEPSVGRSATASSASSAAGRRSDRPVPPRLLPSTSDRDRTAPQAPAPAPPSAYSPSRSRPTGPRTPTSASMSASATTPASTSTSTPANARRRPPPLDLTRNGSTPSVGRR